MKRCPNCGKNFPDDANFCPTDAGRLEADAGSTHKGHAAPGAVEETALGGRFDVGGTLGGGLTGEVYHARDRERGETCAVKLVHAAVFPNPLLLQRAERELKQLERLQLGEVARVLAHGRRGDQLWIAMELVDGRPLDVLVQETGPLAPGRAVRLVRAVAHGLVEAAKHGVIHRDVAAKNILVSPQASATGKDQVKIINFSIAVPFSDRVQGTAEFLSPEQVEGKPADQRSSIYSLGALLYFALTGQPPFTGSVTEVHQAHRMKEVVRPSQLVPMPPALDAIVMKALEKASAKRYMTLHQMVTELDGFIASGAAAPVAAAGQGKPAAPLAQTMMGVSAFGGAPHPAPAAGQGAGETTHGFASAAGSPVPAGAPAVLQHQAPHAQPAPQQPAPPQAVHAQPAYQQPMHQQPMHQQPMHQQPMHQQPFQHAPVPNDTQPVSNAPFVVTKRPGEPVNVSNKTGGKKKGGGKPSADKGKFRETMWFKKGELDAAAAQNAAQAREGDIVPDKADALPIEDRYKDDGSIGRGDAERFSLRTGATHTNLPQIRDGRGANQVSEDELLSEMKKGRGLLIALVLLGLVGIGVVIALFAF